MPEKFLISGVFQRFVRLNKRFLEEDLKKYNVTYEQYNFLYMLSINPSCNQNYLCEYFNAKKSLVSNVLRVLEDRNYITQNVDPDNRRAYIVNVTPEGLEIVKDIHKKDEEFEELFFSLLDVEKEEFMRKMEQVYNGILKD